MNGYTTTPTRETKRHNELHAVTGILIANPDNQYWQSRLAAVRDDIDTDHLAELIDICNTDPRHVLNTAQAVDDWMQRDGAAATYGEAWYAEQAARHADWLDEQRTQEDARY